MIVAGMMAFGLTLLVLLRWCPDYGVIRRILLAGIGEALIVAAALALTVDRYIKSDLVRESIQVASKDLHKYLVGYHLPDELKERIQELMCEPIIRSDWRIDYVLSPEDNGEVTIDVTYTFNLKNVTNGPVPYVPMIQMEKHLNPKIVELRCDDEISHFRHIAEEGGTLGKESESVPGLIEFRHPEMEIKPTSGRDAYPFKGRYQLRTPANHGDTFSFGRPSLSVTITTTAPPGYRFSIEPSPWMVQTENMYQIKKRAFLRSESVMIRWMKVQDQASNRDKSNSV